MPSRRVHREGHPVDERSLIRGQVKHGAGHILHSGEAEVVTISSGIFLIDITGQI